jgi:molybdopterin-guanine dinucleotide biosynthesis protein A
MLNIGLVLAGGRSSRMGTDKALLSWHGRPLLDHMIGLLERSGVDRVYVSGARAGYAAIADAWPERGPVGGIASAADALPDCRLLVVPVDAPLLTPDLLQPLLESDASGARWAASMLPLALSVDARTRQLLHELLALPARQCSVRALLDGLDIQIHPIDEASARQLANVNTPQAWQEIAS